MTRTPGKRSQDYITVGEVRDMLAKMQSEAKANHERLASGVQEALAVYSTALQQQVERIDRNADLFQHSIDRTLDSFRKGTREFGSVVDSRFTNVWNKLYSAVNAIDDMERRTLRGRARRLRAWLLVLFSRSVMED